MDKALLKGFQEARRITEKNAKTFYLASWFLKKEKRDAACSVYAACLDHDSIEARLNGGMDDPLSRAFRETVERYSIPGTYFDELVEGMRSDLSKKRYADFEELYSYCFRTAGIAGLVMNRILVGSAKSADKCAEKLGIAMQLTNILRDVREDYARGRVYLPKDEMERFGVTEASIASWRTNNKLKELMKFEIERARKYYKESVAGVAFMPDVRSRIAAIALKELYEALLHTIERRGYDVFSRRPYLTFFQKVWIIIRVLLGRKYLVRSASLANEVV